MASAERSLFVYAESSAVLSWLLEEEGGEDVRRLLGAAEGVATSRLTLAECGRAVTRETALGRISESKAVDRVARLHQVEAHWTLYEVDASVLERVARPFPHEPLRTLDAVHLATALALRAAYPGLALLTLDDRIRASASALGFDVLPVLPE